MRCWLYNFQVRSRNPFVFWIQWRTVLSDIRVDKSALLQPIKSHRYRGYGALCAMCTVLWAGWVVVQHVNNEFNEMSDAHKDTQYEMMCVLYTWQGRKCVGSVISEENVFVVVQMINRQVAGLKGGACYLNSIALIEWSLYNFDGHDTHVFMLDW